MRIGRSLITTLIRHFVFMMNSDSNLISLIENFPVSASIKESDTGKYVINNCHNLRQFGVGHWRDIAGLRIEDIKFHQPEWGAHYARSVEMLDISTRETKTHAIGRHRFIDNYGDVQMEEMTKFPIIGIAGNVIGIATYRHDITRTLPPIGIYRLYRNFYQIADAIKRALIFFGVESSFISPPTEAQICTFLLKVERYSNKEVARFMGVSDRTVECHCVALRNKIVDGDLARAAFLLTRNLSCGDDSIQY